MKKSPAINLSTFGYTGIDDPSIEKDIKLNIAQMAAFEQNHKGKLTTTLYEALIAKEEMTMVSNKIVRYLQIHVLLNASDGNAANLFSSAYNRLVQAESLHESFFEQEIASLDEQILDKLFTMDERLQKYRMYLQKMRITAKYQLAPLVELALTKRRSALQVLPDTLRKFTATLKAPFPDTEGLSINQLTELLERTLDNEKRAAYYGALNATQGGNYATVVATAFNVLASSAVIEANDRGVTNPMEFRNVSNGLTTQAVEALHQAVRNSSDLVKRFYKLKAKYLGLTQLNWWDRMVMVSKETDTPVVFNDAVTSATTALNNFSPTLARIFSTIINNGWIDAVDREAKRAGAANIPFMLPGYVPVSLIVMDYAGTRLSKTKLVHEGGHGIHNILSGGNVGPLLHQTPTVVSENASIFAELLDFHYTLQELLKAGDTNAVTALIMDKLSRMFNSTVQQIVYSNFERRIHGNTNSYDVWEKPQPRTPEEYSALFIECATEVYGDTFNYEGMENAWAGLRYTWDYQTGPREFPYAANFTFYGYAAGELFAQSLYAQKDILGDKFEPLYIELLKKGGSENAQQLLAPFGLNPENPDFWKNGIELSLGRLVTQLESLL